MIKTFFKSALPAVLIIIGIISGVRAEGITAAYGRQVSALRGEVIWFINGINERLLLGDDNESDQYFYVTTENRNPKAAVRFSSDETPLYIKNLIVMICNVDLFPALPGNQNSPFEMCMCADNLSQPGEIIIPNQTLSAQGYWSGESAWVPMSTRYMLTGTGPFWGVFSWNPETPSAPILAVDYDVGWYNTLIGLDEGGFSWQEYQAGNVIMRAEVLKNDLDGIFSIAPGVAVPDSFHVYYSGQPVVYADEAFYDTTVIGNLHSRVVLPGPDNYFCVTSFQNNQESFPTPIVYIHGSSAATADLDFEPRYFEVTLPDQRDTSLYVTIENDEDEEIHFRVEDVTVEGFDPGQNINLGIIPSEGNIPIGRDVNLRIDLNVGSAPTGDYGIEVTFAIWDINKSYRDRYFPIDLTVTEFTSVDDDDDAPVPGEFSLGQNYPNPFNGATVIPFRLGAEDTELRLEIFDILGRRVYHQKLIDHSINYIIWEGVDNAGNNMPSGLYFYQIGNSTLRKTRKMLYLK